MATPEERPGWLSNWVESLYEFASPAFQRRLWGVEGAIPNCIGSHTELMCGYFDDCNLTEGYEWAIGEGLLSPAEARAADRLHRAADAYDTEYDRDAEYLSDPAWQDVCSLAADAWRRLDGVAGDDVLAEMRRCEETWGGVSGGRNPDTEGHGA